MHCVFVVHASPQVGIGHLMRCLALSQAIQTHRFKATFLLDEQSEVIARARNDWCGNIIKVDYQAPVEQHIEVMSRTQQNSVDWVIIDGYSFDRVYCQAWQKQGLRVALFDDGVHHAPYGVDLLINASSNLTTSTDGTPMLSGAEYRLLRQEFKNVQQISVNQRHFLTLSFGGSDPANITLPLLRLMQQRQFHAPLCVITGQAYPFLAELNELVTATSLSIKHMHAAQNMADVWLNSKLAVSAAGGSQFELAVCATSSVLIAVAENQLSASELAAKEGWCMVANMIDTNKREQQLEELCNLIETLWSNPQKLETMQQAVLGTYNASGAERLVAALSQYHD